MILADKAKALLALHIKGAPLVLHNIWDVGGVKAVEQIGAKAIATSSWSIAASLGYEDGENLPLETLLNISARIVQHTDLPVSVDFESGYGVESESVARNVTSLLQSGVVGFNIEDRSPCDSAIYDAHRQGARICAARDAADRIGVRAVINARTDLFLQENDVTKHGLLINDAIMRAKIYKDFGADCFFIPGVCDPKLVAKICSAVELPVNVMACDMGTDLKSLKQAGVARISFGAEPYRNSMASLQELASKHL